MRRNMSLGRTFPITSDQLEGGILFLDEISQLFPKDGTSLESLGSLVFMLSVLLNPFQ
jgi:hypothetical protein